MTATDNGATATQRQKVRRRRGRFVAGVVVGVLVTGGITYAAIPDRATGRIAACYGTDGVLRVTDTACPSGTTRVTWQSDGIRYRGPWSAGARYSANDVVTRRGASYIARRDNAGKGVGSGRHWAVLAAQGRRGARGRAGETGPVTSWCAATERWDRVECRTATITTGEGPNGAASDGRHVWVANQSAGTVTRIDPRTNEVVASIDVRNVASVAFDGSSIWVTNGSGVAQIDRSTNEVVRNIILQSVADAIIFDGTYLWTIEWSRDVVDRIDPDTGTVTEVVVGDFPLGLAFDGQNVWVTNGAGGTVSRIRASTATVTGTVNVPSTPAGIVFDGAAIWVSNRSGGTLTRIDPVSATVLGTEAMPGLPDGLAFDGQHIWACLFNVDKVARYDPVTDRVTTVDVGDSPQNITFDGTNLWLGNVGEDTVTRLVAG